MIYAVIALCVRKKATAHIGLCGKHRSRRKTGIAVGWLGGLGGVAMIVGGAVGGSGILAVLGIVLLLGGLIWAALTGARVSPAKITKDNIWIKGASQAFLAELPEWPGA